VSARTKIGLSMEHSNDSAGFESVLIGPDNLGKREEISDRVETTIII